MKNYKLGIAATALLTAFAFPAMAATCSSEDGGSVLIGQCTAEPESFVQTIKTLRLIRLNDDNTTTFVEISNTPMSFDFASVTAGADIGEYISGATIPDGTYVGLSPIIDKMATLRASVLVDGIPCRTTVSGAQESGAAAADYTFDSMAGGPFSTNTDSAYDYDSAGAETEWLNGDGDLVIAKKFTPFTVNTSSTTNVNINFAFDAAEAATFSYNGATCDDVFLGPLSVTITTSATTE